jgi:hypothetical protein
VLTAAYPIATLLNVTGLFHHVELQKASTTRHPVREIRAGRGWAKARRVKGL